MDHTPQVVRGWLAVSSVTADVRQNIEGRLRRYEAKFHNAPITREQMSGWIFNGYPKVLNAFLMKHPFMDPLFGDLPIARRPRHAEARG